METSVSFSKGLWKLKSPIATSVGVLFDFWKNPERVYQIQDSIRTLEEDYIGVRGGFSPLPWLMEDSKRVIRVKIDMVAGKWSTRKATETPRP